MEYAAYGDAFVPVGMMGTRDYKIKDCREISSPTWQVTEETQYIRE